MKKMIKISLILLGILLILGGVFAYNVFITVIGSEKITGNQGIIPKETVEFPALTTGAHDWPNWRGINFDGKSSFTRLKTDWTNGLEKSWEVDFLCQGQATASWSSPVIRGNRLIIPGRDENNDLVFCLNSENGELIWKASYPAEAGISHGPGPRATPFIDEDRVYTYGRSGDLVCWNLFDGNMIWHKNVKDEGGEEPDWGLSSTPLVINDRVIVQGGGKALVLAYDKITGKLIWKSLEGPAGYCATLPLSIDSAYLILVYHAKALSCLDPENGKEQWHVPWETDYGVNASTPIIDGDLVFHTSGYGKGAQVLQVSKNGYKIRWSNKVMAAQHSDPFLIDGFIYGYSGQSTSNRGEFKCIDLQSGKEIWSTKELGNGTATFVDGHLICLDLKGNLFLIKPEPSGFIKIAEFKNAIPEVKSLSWTLPVVANGKLYVRYLQRLICYDLEEKKTTNSSTASH